MGRRDSPISEYLVADKNKYGERYAPVLCQPAGCQISTKWFNGLVAQKFHISCLLDRKDKRSLAESAVTVFLNLVVACSMDVFPMEMDEAQPGVGFVLNLLFLTLCTSRDGWLIPLGCFPKSDGSCLRRVADINRLMGDAKSHRLSRLADLVDG